LHLFVSVEQPGHNLGVLKLNVIHLVGRASLFLDLLNVLLNLFDLLIESLLVGVNDMMALLESHCLLVQIDAKGYPEHSDQSLHQE
jgi:hypothetical protein